MKNTGKLFGIVLAGFGLAMGVGGCGSKGGGTRGATQTQQGSLLVTAGVQPLTPASADTVSATVDLAPLGNPQVSEVYDVTTPAGEAFAINLFTRNRGNVGDVRVSLAHLLDGGAAPVGTSTIVRAGVIPVGGGLVDRSPWLDSAGDGFSRISLQGSVTQPQVYAVQAETPAGVQTALIRVAIGPRSPINVDAQLPIPAPFVLDHRTLYSSDSFQFGLPTCATSGDRTTVVAYEGDDGDPFSGNRYELRMQYDRTTGAVTGGASDERSPDRNNWRDHEIAALFNVLAVVKSGENAVSCRLSFDRGATFAQTATFPAGLAQFRARLVQCAMAADYTLAVLYWRPGADFLSELVLVEGTPSSVDANGSPTAYAFGAPQVIHRTAQDATPAIVGAEYSAGGDLVVGYGYSTWSWDEVNRANAVRSSFYCSTRLFGAAAFQETLVDEDVTFNYDPSVALVGQGAGLSIYYGYETRGGVRMARSVDAGASFSAPQALGGDGAHLPKVFAVDVAGALRVDVLFLQPGTVANELHLARYSDYAASQVPTVYRLTTATQTTGPGGTPVLTGVGWLGYDACLDGDDVVITYDETREEFLPMPMPVAMGLASGAPNAQAAQFTAATPPPLAPGLTTPLAAPNAADRHQLKLMRLD
ncbi:MAG: hypothetical protein KDD82_15030 [Planctomycetes bacterium]|nr:hypothetical protein [Planctomycetota bacterium]